jgi:hypothetical protein
MPSQIISGYKLQFYSADQHEPPHIHVVKAEKRAKIWLDDLSVAWSRHFNARELNRVLEIVDKHQKELTEWYYGFFA